MLQSATISGPEKPTDQEKYVNRSSLMELSSVRFQFWAPSRAGQPIASSAAVAVGRDAGDIQQPSPSPPNIHPLDAA